MIDDTQALDFLNLTAGKEGVNITTACPDCGHRNFSVMRANGKLLWNCFRASCGERGGVFIPGNAFVDTRESKPLPSALNPYTGAMIRLRAEQAERLAYRFDISVNQVFRHICCDGRKYVLHILDPVGKLRGHTRRIPWKGTELYVGQVWNVAPKSTIFQSLPGPLLAWYGGTEGRKTAEVILVEDQISAIKLAQDGRIAVALLGTALNDDKIAELQRHASSVVLALDKDATSLAFKYARKYQHAFRNLRVVCLTKDVKDMALEEARATFG